jgi:cytochrome c-type biogenesis protein CcmH
MISFWIIAACLLAVALLFVLLPLARTARHYSQADSLQNQSALQNPIAAIYQDQLAELERDRKAGFLSPEQFTQAQKELELRLVDDMPQPNVAPRAHHPSAKQSRLAMLGMTLALPLCAVLLYLQLGKPETLVPANMAAAGNTELSNEQISAMVDKLAAKLKDNPDDAKGWHMLARSYVAFGRFPDAVQAFERTYALSPKDPQVLADYADAVGAVNGGNLNGKPAELVKAALAINPDHFKSLALAATIAFNNRDYALAISHWQHLQKTLPKDAEDIALIGKNIEEAQAAMGAPKQAGAQPAQNTAQQTTATATATTTSTAITGTVSISPVLASKLSPQDTLFVYARAASGPKMPLAIIKAQAKDLPLIFKLDDSSAMSPAMKLSDFKEVMLSARVSKSGNAIPQSGDLTGSMGPMPTGTQSVKLLIDSTVP